MAYPMSHLYIAEHLLKDLPKTIENTSQYYLGTLAPDAVHFRKNYDRQEKEISHLYADLAKDNIDIFTGNWKANIMTFFLKYKSQNIFDFLLGYCIHLMVDVYSYKYIWTPFKLQFSNNKAIDFGEIYKEESLLADLELFQRNNFEQNIFPLINIAEEADFFDLVFKDDIKGLKNNILNIQYKDKNRINSSANKYIVYEKIIKTNNKIVEYVNQEFITRAGKM
jgi:hypothetical protein